MQRITAIHDGTLQGWDCLYLALHISARLGTDLQVLTSGMNEQGHSPAQMTERIVTAGNAAGIAVQAEALPELTTGAVLEQAGDVSALLIPAGLLSQPDLLPGLATSPGCPVWVVPQLVEIRRLAALLEPAADQAARNYASALSQRLGAGLLFLAESTHPLVETEFPLSRLTSFSPEALGRLVELEHLDLLIFPFSLLQLCMNCAPSLSCLMAVCPPQDGNALN